MFLAKSDILWPFFCFFSPFSYNNCSLGKTLNEPVNKCDKACSILLLFIISYSRNVAELL